MIIRNKYNGYSRDGIRLYPISSGNNSGPTSSTVTQSTIPEQFYPQIETVLGGGLKQLFNTTEIPGIVDPETGIAGKSTFDITGTKPYIPYSANPQDYMAGFSPLQRQVQSNAANLQMPGQYGEATDMVSAAGMGGMRSAEQANMYGAQGQQSGLMGQQMGIQGGQYYGDMGAQAGLQGQQSGLMGQDIGIQGGALYGGMGAGYGQDAANLANQAQNYGQAGYESGALGQDYALAMANQYGNLGAGYGSEAAALAPEAQGYGRSAADIGQMALQAQDYGQMIGGQAQDYAAQAAAAGQNYAQQATSPQTMQQYMSPYVQNVIDVQNTEAQRQADIASTQRGSAAARAGAFGGARQAIENAEAQRNLATLQNANQAQGLQQAYQQAQQAQQYGANLGLQGLSGAQQGLGTALQGGQLGLSGIGQAMAGQQAGMQGLTTANQLYGSGMQGAGMGLQAAQVGLQGTAQGMQGAQSGLAGLNAANQAYQTGIQGAGMGLQGVNTQLAGTAQGMQGAQSAMQGAGVGLSGVDRALAGTAQGMQGAQAGLAGVSGAQAGYGLLNQAGSNMANIGNQQLAAQTGILGLQNQIGAEQQAREQGVINNAINNFGRAQEQPMTALQQYNALLRGYAMPGSSSNTYQAPPSVISQLAGAGTSALAANQLFKGAAGGRPQDYRRKTRGDGLDALAMYKIMRGAA